MKKKYTKPTTQAFPMEVSRPMLLPLSDPDYYNVLGGELQF